MPILRRWTGRIRTSDRHRYVAYVAASGFTEYALTPGNLGAEILSRDLGDGTTEVATLSWWTSMAAIAAFAGDDPGRAKYYPEDDDFLIERPDTVEHFVVEAGLFASA